MISADDQNLATKWIKSIVGIDLAQDKKYLIESRFEPVAKQYGFNSVPDLIRYLDDNISPDSEIVETACSAITTHETSFFRDFHPFEFLKNVYFPNRLRDLEGGNQLRIWSSACSSGQEIYSVAMILARHFQPLWKNSPLLHATDISKSTLHKAQSGIFTQSEITRGLSANYLIEYFGQQKNKTWAISPTLRRSVVFELHNLTDSWDHIQTYDVIFLRNVLIYFNVESKKKILNRIKRHLAPGGIMLLGSSETTANLDFDWELNRSCNCTYFTLKKEYEG